MSKHIARRGTQWAPLFVLVIVIVVTVLTRIPHFGTGELDFDEGVYWLSLRSMRLGNHLYSQVYSSQPPLFLQMLEPLWSGLGGTLEAARVLMTSWDVVALLAATVVGWRLVSPWAGVAIAIVVAVDPRMVFQSVILQADGPAATLALCALAGAAIAITARGRRSAVTWAAVAGALLVAGILTKLFDVGLVPVIALTLLLSGRRVWLLAAAAAGGVVLAAAVLLPLSGVWSQMWDQAVGVHLSTRGIYSAGAGFTFSLLRTELSTEWPIAAVAAFGALTGWWGDRRLWLVGMVWCIGGGLALLATKPTYPHHEAVMVPGLACVAVSGLLAVVRAGRSARLPRRTRRPLAVLGAVVATAYAVGVLATALGSLRPTPVDPERATAIDDFVPASALVLTDDQFELAAANRDSPPQWVDTSLVRFFGSDVTAAEVAASVAANPDVCAVLIESNHLNHLPGLIDWAATAFPEHHTLDGGAILDVRPGCPA